MSATRADLGLAIGLALLGITEAAIPLETVMGAGPLVLAGVLAGLTPLALVIRRSYPLWALAAVVFPWAGLSLVVSVPVMFWGGLIPLGVATYSAARHGTSRTAWIGAVFCAAGLLTFNVGTGMIHEAGQLVFPWLALAATWRRRAGSRP